MTFLCRLFQKGAEPGAADFAAFYQVLSLGLPEAERRSAEGQRALFEEPAYRLALGYQGDRVCAGLAFWELDGWLYAEHLAVRPELRNQGAGSDMIQKYILSSRRPVVFEVEPPGSAPMASRRIGLYERLGFVLCPFGYLMPPLNPGQPPTPLRLMTSRPLSPEDFAALRELLYRQVYHLKDGILK